MNFSTDRTTCLYHLIAFSAAFVTATIFALLIGGRESYSDANSKASSLFSFSEPLSSVYASIPHRDLYSQLVSPICANMQRIAA